MTPSPNKIKALFFDIGGVLVNVDSSRAVDQLSKKLDVTSEQIREAMTFKLLNDYEKGHLSSNQFYETMLVGCESRNKMTLETFRSYWQDVLYPKPDVIDFLSQVSKTYPVWLLSNTNDFHYDLLMQDFPFMQWVKGGTYSFMEGTMKPDAQIYQIAISRSGFRPEDILFIDDLQTNVLAAQDQGINVIQYLNFKQFSAEVQARFPELGVFL